MAKKSEAVYVALLRGVNVTGFNKLPMKTLAELCEEQGCTGVKTYIQSGNVVFRAGAKTAAGFARTLEEQIHEKMGFETKVILRTPEELARVARNNPFLTDGVDTKFLHVAFLGSEPNVTQVVKLDPGCVGEEAFSLRGKEIYLYAPHGFGSSKMARYPFDKKLGVVCSTRNWRTVQELLRLCEEARAAA